MRVGSSRLSQTIHSEIEGVKPYSWSTGLSAQPNSPPASRNRADSTVPPATAPLHASAERWVSPRMIWFILVLLVFGLLFGLIARALVPGDDSMSLFQTWALGVGGSLLGGFLGSVLFGFDSDDGALQAGGLVGSIIGSVLLLLIVRAVRSND